MHQKKLLMNDHVNKNDRINIKWRLSDRFHSTAAYWFLNAATEVTFNQQLKVTKEVKMWHVFVKKINFWFFIF